MVNIRAYILLAPLFALAACNSGGSGETAAPAVAQPPSQPEPPPVTPDPPAEEPPETPPVTPSPPVEPPPAEPPPVEPPPVEPPPAEPPPVEPPPAEPPTILPLGDSITQGNTNNNSYRRPLWHALVDAGYTVDFVGSHTTNNNGPPPNPDFDLHNEGHWGWRADALLASLPGWLNGYTPDVVLMHAGSNDAFQSQSTSSTVAELETIIDVLRADNPNVTILLAQLIPAADSARNNRINELNAQIPGIVSRKSQSQSPVYLVDQNTGFLLSDLRDGVHPTLAGQQKMAAKWFETLAIVLDTVDTTAPAISAVSSLDSPAKVTVVFEEPSAEQPPPEQQPPAEEEPPVAEEEEIPLGWEAPFVEEILTYQVQRVPSIEGGEDGQLTGRSINNHGHVSGTVWFLDADPPSSLGFVWFGGEQATDANELIHPDDPMRETTFITDVIQINDEYYMAGLAGDPTVLDWRGRPTAFSFAYNGHTGRLHWLTEAFIWPFMAPDGRVVSEDAGDTVFIWDGESVYRWADPDDDSLWIDRVETCAVTVFDDRGLVYDFGTTENACWVRYEHLFTYQSETDWKFFHRIEGHERFSFWLNYVVDMNDHGQLLIDGCIDEEVWECGTFVFTPIATSEPN